MKIFDLSSFNSIGNNLLYELRDRELQQTRWIFRRNLHQLGLLLAYELSKSLQYDSKRVQTPLDELNTRILSSNPLLVTILRAAVPFYEGVQEIFRDAECGFAGAVRTKENGKIGADLSYFSLPDPEGKDVILIDPMLATGSSITRIFDSILKNKPYRSLHLISVVAAPEGIKALQKNLPDHLNLWTGAIDEKLDERYYIIPGLGDAGDLSFGKSKLKG